MILNLKAMQVLIMSNSFNPELQLKDTESAIKSKVTDLSSQLKGFKLILVFKKI